jgi:hypothetical protein
MLQTPVDYSIFFRELSTVPDDIGPLTKSFYEGSKSAMTSMQPMHNTNQIKFVI